MAYKRKRYSRKFRPRKRRRTSYKRRYTKRFSKFYNMRQRKPISRSSFRNTRDVVFPDAPSRSAIAPKDYGSWNPYLAAVLAAGALGGGYGLKQGLNAIMNPYTQEQIADYQAAERRQDKGIGENYAKAGFNLNNPSNVQGRSRSRKARIDEQAQTQELLNQGFKAGPSYADFLASYNLNDHPDRPSNPNNNEL